MKSNKLIDFGIEDLMNEEKNAKKTLNVWAAIFGITSGISIFGIINKGFEFYFLLPSVITAVYAIKHWKELKKIKAEISSR